MSSGPNPPGRWPDPTGDPAETPEPPTRDFDPFSSPSPGVPAQPGEPAQQGVPPMGQPAVGQPPPPEYQPGSASVPSGQVPQQYQAAPAQWQQPPPPQWQQPAPEHWQPAPGEGGAQQWPGAYPPIPQQAHARKRRGPAVILSTVGIIVLVACIAGAIRIVPTVLDNINDAQGAPSATHPSGVFATSTATSAPTGPFENTPAATYPAGAAGITLPAATAISGFTKAQVAASLDKVKKALIAARLDTKMLVNRDPSTLINMLAPDARPSIRNDFDKKDFFIFASQLAPGSTLTSDGPRVKGRVTFRAAKDGDIRLLEVITNFVWVYPFSGSLAEPGDHLVVVHDEVHWMFPASADVENSSRGMWIDAAEGYASNIDCDQLKKSLLALGKPEAVLPGSGEDEDTMFDPDRSLAIKETC